MAKKGKIDISSLSHVPEQHEFETAKYFSALGFEIEFLQPSQKRGVKTPDIKMDNLFWEIKSPTGSSKHTIGNILRLASRQSAYVILDLRRVNILESSCLVKAKYDFKIRSAIKRLIIIKKDGKHLELNKKM